MRSYIIPLVAAFIFSSCATVLASPCDTNPNRIYSNWKQDTLRKNSDKHLIENYLRTNQRTEFVAAYNATPPVTNENPANVAVWSTMAAIVDHLAKRARNGIMPSGIVIFIDASDCIISTETVPMIVLDKWLRGIPFIKNSEET